MLYLGDYFDIFLPHRCLVVILEKFLWDGILMIKMKTFTGGERYGQIRKAYFKSCRR